MTHCFELKNTQGTTILLSSYGAAIRQCLTADKEGAFANINMTVEYPNRSYAGLTVGPVAGRIRGGQLTVHKTQYQLECNDGKNHIHGGSVGCSFREWQPESISSGAASFSLILKDGEDGYPGNRQLHVTYTLTESNELIIQYRGSTDKPTVFSLTNHVYWNLSGLAATPNPNQMLQIKTDSVWTNDEENLPTRAIPVVNTPYDFNMPKTVVDQPYNNAFEAQQAYLYDIDSGRTLTLQTDYPSIVLYNGYNLSNDMILIGNKRAVPYCCVALEAQQLPDAIHIAPSTDLITEPGTTWERMISFRFGLL